MAGIIPKNLTNGKIVTENQLQTMTFVFLSYLNDKVFSK